MLVRVLARCPSTMQKLRSVQILRGVAACGVLFMHAHIWGAHAFSRPLSVGGAGVDLFFVVSGFIMVSIASGKRPIEFLMDRLVRIFPLWWIALVPWVLAKGSSWFETLASIALIPIYPIQAGPVLGAGWTLSFELLFYGGFALALATRKAVPIGLFVGSLALAVTTKEMPFVFVGSPIILEFLLGAVIATLPRISRLGLPSIVLSAIWLALFQVGNAEPSTVFTPTMVTYRVLAWGIPAGMLFYGAVSLESYFASLAFTPLVFLGDASYSIYLFHPMILAVSPFQWFVGASLAIVFGIFMHLLVEAPMMRLWSAFRTSRCRALPVKSQVVLQGGAPDAAT